MMIAPATTTSDTVDPMNIPGAPDVLIVDDEPQVRHVVATYLEREGFNVRSAADGQEALAEIAKKRPDAMVLDLMLPGVNGLDVLRKLREDGDEVPVIVLSARGAEPDRVAGLELGADDYVSKPFSPREIVARVKAVLRRGRLGSEQRSSVFTFGSIVVDLNRRQVTLDGNETTLASQEFALLEVFLDNQGVVMSRQQLLDQAWGNDWIGDPRTVDVHVRQLRKKLGDDLSLVTVRGYGYRMG